MFISKIVPLAAVFISGARAQTNTAHCGSGFDWNKNSLGQDPCTVGSMLDASCRGHAEYNYPPLNSTQYYLPPRTNHSGDLTCDCNTVMYSLYMACASCQGGETYSWIQWISQCSSGVYVTQYPIDLAQGTAVPHWAYYNITLLPNQLYNDSVAQKTGRDPETFPKQINTLSTGSSVSGSSTITKSSTGGLQATGTNSNSKGGTNVGAIVGGVVGTIVPLTILGVVVFLYTRNRRSPQHQEVIMPGLDDDPYKQRPISYGTPMGSAPHFTPYDPSDPSTFPPQSPQSSVTYTTPPNNNARGIYSGMPEI